MRVLVVTKIFPNALEPLSAPFNRQQIAALAHHCDVEVLATIPWFPGAGVLSRWWPVGRLTAVPRGEVIDGLQVTHPRVLYLPRFGHALSAVLYAASVLPEVLRRRGQFDVLLGSWAYPDGAATVALGAALGVPTVVKLHGSDMDVLALRPTLRAQMALALSRAARVVAVSRKLAEAAEGLGVPPDRIDVIGNGVDGTVFYPRDKAKARAELGHPGDDRKWILYVGRIESDKGLLDLADAFRVVAAARPDATLVLVGEGRARTVVEETLRPLGDRVVFLGPRPFTEVPIWMGASDLLTLPSHHEGTPNVILEALACGRRVVATRVGGIPDVIHRQDLGALVPVHDTDALAAALIAALDQPYDPAAVAALGTRGGWDESASRLHDTLARAMATGSPGTQQGSSQITQKPNEAGMASAARASDGQAASGAAKEAPKPEPAAAEPGVRRLAPPARIPGWKSRLVNWATDIVPHSILVRRRSNAERRVALTFDDGPNEMTDAYLEVLGRFGVRATFFVVGAACAGREDVLLRMAAQGHELAGHGYTHRIFPELDGKALRQELQRTAELLPPARTARPLIRPPRGATSLRSLAVCAHAGYTTVHWSLDSDDCRTSSPDEIVARLSPAVLRPGEIVLLHEGQDWTLAALPRILEALAAAGWRSVPVGELLD